MASAPVNLQVSLSLRCFLASCRLRRGGAELTYGRSAERYHVNEGRRVPQLHFENVYWAICRRERVRVEMLYFMVSMLGSFN